MLLRVIGVLVFVLCLVVYHPVWAQATAALKIDTGLIIGTSHGGVDAFKGIPYAAPPVGPLRWRAPQPASAWSGIRSVDRFGFMCIQPVRPSGRGTEVRAEDMSEDCLTLNVYRPNGATGSLPVMVWIHGGGFTAGASSVPTYDGEAFARGGVVLVSINYRLGRLGVFAHPALTAANADGGRLANYGLMDQIAALQWVARNIAVFGGDPKNVTIFGESAGGLSVNALMVAPQARGLFHRAISESGYGRGSFSRMTQTAPDGRRAAETEGTEFATALGVKGNDLAALRAVPAAAIIEQFKPQGYLYFVLDGKVLPQDMWATFRAKKEAPVPFMLGSNSHEFPSVAWKDRRSDLRSYTEEAKFPALAKAYGGPEALDYDLMSDFLFTEQARALAQMHAKNGYPTYLYLFSTVSDEAAAEGKGAPHGSEIRYVFDTLGVGSTPLTGVAEQAVARSMNATWCAFATKGEPNAPGLPPWPRYDTRQLMEFTLHGTRAHQDVRNDRLDALARAIDGKS